MVKLIQTLILIRLVLALDTAKAQYVEVKIPSYAEVNKPFKVEYRITDMKASIEAINPPKADGLTLIYGPALSRTSSTEVMNGRAISKTSQAVIYTYVADKPGNYFIGSPEIYINGRLIKIKPTKIEVRKTALPEQSRAIFQYIVIPERRQVYQNEAIRITYRLQGTRPFSLRDITPAISDGFVIHRVEMDQYNQMRSERIGGRDWMVVDLSKEIAIAQHAGKNSLGSGGRALVAYSQPESVEDIFMQDLQTSSVTSTESTLNVKPLPIDGKEGFSGAVGSFSIKYELPEKWKTNETSILRVIIEGEGSLQMFEAPKVILPNTFDVYDPLERTETGYTQGSLHVRHSIEYSIIPRQVGKILLPELKFKYFDPRSGSYRQTSTPSQQISVQVGKANTSNSSIIKMAGHTEKSYHEALSEYSEPYTHLGVGYLLIYPLLFVIACVVYPYLKRYQTKRANAIEYAVSRAGKKALRAINKVSEGASGPSNEHIYTLLDQILLGYLSDKFRLPAYDLNRHQIHTTLSDLLISELDLKDLDQILDEIELLRYGLHEQKVEDQLVKSVKDLILKLETY